MVGHIAKLCFLIILGLTGCRRAGQPATHSEQASDGCDTQSPQKQEPKEKNIVSDSNKYDGKQAGGYKKNIVVTGPNDMELEMVYIEPGSFIMGRDTTIDSLISMINFEFGIYLDEGPPRKVTITKGFYIGKYPVTASQYCKFLNYPDVNQPEKFITFNRWSRILKRDGRFVPRPEKKDCAVNTVPWEGASAFCQWLSKRTGRRLRLPTEAEWEFTARGPEGRKFPCGNKEPEWLYEMKEPNEAEFYKPWTGLSVYSIAERYPSLVTPDGVVGMCMNRGEWVQDYYAPYPRKDEIDPTGPEEPPVWPLDGCPNYRVLRRGGPTERTLGYNAEDGGIYSFRISMSLDEEPPEQRKPPSIELPIEFTVSQRSFTALPKSDGRLLLWLDDITGGQVLVTVSRRYGDIVIVSRSLQENDIMDFTLDSRGYKLKLKTLTNKLIGIDYAVFQLWLDTAEAEKPRKTE